MAAAMSQRAALRPRAALARGASSGARRAARAAPRRAAPAAAAAGLGSATETLIDGLAPQEFWA